METVRHACAWRANPFGADARLGGYGLVLTWVSSVRGNDQIGETLVVVAGTAAAGEFTKGALGGQAFLAGSDLRLFEGETERTGVQIPSRTRNSCGPVSLTEHINEPIAQL